jgi:hypothetical protein
MWRMVRCADEDAQTSEKLRKALVSIETRLRAMLESEREPNTANSALVQRKQFLLGYVRGDDRNATCLIQPGSRDRVQGDAVVGSIVRGLDNDRSRRAEPLLDLQIIVGGRLTRELRQD